MMEEKKQIRNKYNPKFFSFGTDGFVYALRNERHIRWYLLYLLVFIIVSLILRIPNWLFAYGFLYFSLVMAFEVINTAMEKIADFIAEGHSQEIKRIKDLGAASVFIIGLIGGAILIYQIVIFVLW
jgi:diacylglycerol kinase